MLFGYTLEEIIIRILAVLLAMSIHEMAHGLVSWWLGDPTAKRAGRLSLNPLAHVDWVGFASLLIFGFGWAQPVPIDSSYYRNSRAGIIWTSFAGPAANFLLTLVCLFIYMLLAVYAPESFFTLSIGSFSIGGFVMDLLNTTAIISLGFGIFNLIPIPPLDGAKIFWSFLPDNQYYRLMKGSPWTWLLLIALLYTGILSRPLQMLMSGVYGGLATFFLSILT